MNQSNLKRVLTLAGCLCFGVCYADQSAVSSTTQSSVISYQKPAALLQVAPLVQPAAQVGNFPSSSSSQQPEYKVQPYTRGQTTIPTASPKFPGPTPTIAQPQQANPNASPQFSGMTAQ